MAHLGEPIWPDVEYKEVDIGGEVYYDTVDYHAEIEWMEEQFENQPETGIKGCFISFPRGDGKAIYKVTSLRPLTLSPVMFMDRWEVEYPLIRGLTKRDIEAMVDENRRWKRRRGRR